jgi:hypothetical protein
MSEDAAVPPPGADGTVLVRLRLSPPVRALVQGLIERVHAALDVRRQHPLDEVPGAMPVDEDLLAPWLEGLREGTTHDTRALLALLSRKGFGAEDIPLPAEEAEGVMRACVRVRLHLADTLLRDLKLAEVTGAKQIMRLSLAEQHGYACYRLLVHLEHDLLLQLDPSLPSY